MWLDAAIVVTVGRRRNCRTRFPHPLLRRPAGVKVIGLRSVC